MKWVFSAIGLMSSLFMLIASLFMNYLFLSSLGKTPFEGHVLGAVSASADILKALLPFYIAWAWQQKRYSIVIPGILIWGLFAGFSLLSAVGFSAQNRSVVNELNTDRSTRKSELKIELKRLKIQRAELSKHRSREAVKEAIEGHKQNSRWQTTKGCREATLKSSRVYCRTYFALRAELATAKKADELNQALKNLSEQLGKVTAKHDKNGIGAQVKTLQSILSLSSETLNLFLTILIAVLVEVGSSLGPYLSLGFLINRAKKTKNTNKPVGLIEDFCLICLVSEREGKISNKRLYQAYVDWCGKEGFTALKEQAFFKAFEKLAKDVGIPREKGAFKQIALA